MTNNDEGDNVSSDFSNNHSLETNYVRGIFRSVFIKITNNLILL